MIYLHIGTDKTGSTAIQKLLHWNRTKLLERGLLYPLAGMMHYDHARLKLALDAGDEAPWLRLREEIAQHAGTDVVVSHEGFYHLGPVLLSRLRDWLPDQDVKVILYLRRQDDMIESGILQQLKTREKILEVERLAEDMPWWPHLDYAAVLRRWQDAFGAERITVRPYGRAFLTDEHAIYRDFAACLGRDANMLEGLEWPSRDPNPSLDAASARALMFLHRLGLAPEQHDAVVDVLLHYQRKHGRTESRLFSLEQRHELLSRYSQGNRKISAVPDELFSTEGDPPTPSVADDEVFARLGFLYAYQRFLTGCREWYGEPGFTHLVHAGCIQLIEGFHPVEKWGAWMRGDRRSRLLFRVPRTMVGSLELHIEVQYLPSADTQSRVRLAGADWAVLELHTVIRLPPDAYAEAFGLVFLEFEHERARSPSEVGASEDDVRILGAGIRKLSFRECGP